ncbi:MAG: response regulator [Ignavibacteria bacterium]|nr:response regulator [Ignavibacteria bacterium]
MLKKDKKPAKILIIDDDDTIRQFASDVLTSEGYYVMDVNNAEEGIKKLLPKENKDSNTALEFDIVLCDIMMPGTDGFAVLKKLKKSGKKMPVFIYITAKKERNDLRKAMESGADDYISKPFSADEIKRSVKVQLDKKNIILNTYKIGQPPESSIENENQDMPQGLERFGYEDKVFVTSGTKSRFIFIKDVVLIKSLKDYTQIFINTDEHFFIRKPLKNWARSLPEKFFLLANRSEIVNLNYVSSINKQPNGTHEVELKNYRHKVKISRRIGIKLHGKLKDI